MVPWPCYFEPVTVQFIRAGARGTGGLFTSWKLENKKEKEEEAKVPKSPSRAYPE
jgi:hypothetical protein